MKRATMVSLAMLVLLHSGVSAGQDDATADPRLADPAFVKLRDEALAAAKCPNRTNAIGISTPKPRYPDALRRDRVSGRAFTEVIVLADGKVDFGRVVKATHPEFGTAALEVLKQYRYKPATCDGKPVPRIMTIVQTFSIR